MMAASAADAALVQLAALVEAHRRALVAAELVAIEDSGRRLAQALAGLPPMSGAQRARLRSLRAAVAAQAELVQRAAAGTERGLAALVGPSHTYGPLAQSPATRSRRAISA